MLDLKSYIRSIPDFPKKGILFRDITTLLKDKDVFEMAVELLAQNFLGKHIDIVVAVEARGFVLGGALAYKLGAGFVPVRKKGKLPAQTYSITYGLEYGKDSLSIHKDAINKGARVLIVDDLLATGGTVKATANLVEKLKGKIIGIIFLIELTDLKGKEKIKGYPVFSLIKY